jgi:hypothetical protein
MNVSENFRSREVKPTEESKLFEKVLEEAHLQEMAAVGELRGPKIGHFYLEVFSDEYEHETPHLTLEVPQKPKKKAVAKIVIPEEQPSETDEPEFLWIEDGFAVSGMLRREIAKWFATPGKRGLTGWDRACEFWEGQAKSISWGQKLKDE